MIFQDPMATLNPVLTIGFQISETLKYHRGLDPRAARAESLRILERVRIPGAARRLDDYPHQLSGGMRQRVMIAMSLACRPQLLIADEPTTALDVTIQAEILELIKLLQEEEGMAVIFITHDLGVVSRIADRVAVMYAGQVVETSGVAQLFAQPRHPYTRGLLNCIPVRGKTLPGSRLQAIPGVVPSLVGQVSGCAFRNRCTLADSACEQDPPMVQQGSPGLPHEARCFKLDVPVAAMEVAA
jgi:peptide/nickel transport system ATP-binding protein